MSVQNMRTEETVIAYTNAFGEEMRIPYSKDGWAWRKAAENYSNVRIEKRTVIVRINTSEWEVVG